MFKRQKINLITSKKQFFEARLKELRDFRATKPDQSDLIRRKEATLQEGIRYCNSLLIPIIQDHQLGPDEWAKAEFIGLAELFKDD